MPVIAYKDLKPNMVTASDVISKTGQIIVLKNSVLSEQLIVHMGFYGIKEVSVLDTSSAKEIIAAEEKKDDEIETYAQRIAKSPEFKVFRINYEKKAKFIEQSFNDIVNKNMPIDAEKLIENVLELFPESIGVISLFDMLHNMQQITDTTFSHCINVALISRLIGTWNGMKGHALDLLTLGGLMHDIGKCRIPTEIIEKKGSLNANEYAIIKHHPSFGIDVVQNQEIDHCVQMCILEHHERYDGTGYPNALKGVDIDEFASIVAIADVYDAMTSNRSYRNGLCPFEVIATFENQGINKYNPKYIRNFLKHIADTYINSRVLLNDGSEGKIVMITDKLTRPVIQMDVNFFVSLLEHPDLYIKAIL